MYRHLFSLSPGAEVGRNAPAQTPCEQRGAIGSGREGVESTGQEPIDKRLIPVCGFVAQAEVDVMNLHFAPSRGCQVTCSALRTRTEKHSAVPGVGREVRKQLVEGEARHHNVSLDVGAGPGCSLLDVARTACPSSRVLLNHGSSDGPVQPPDHTVCVPRKVCEDVTHRPARKSRRASNLVRVQRLDSRTEPLMRLPTRGDFLLRLGHDEQDRPGCR